MRTRWIRLVGMPAVLALAIAAAPPAAAPAARAAGDAATGLGLSTLGLRGWRVQSTASVPQAGFTQLPSSQTRPVPWLAHASLE